MKTSAEINEISNALAKAQAEIQHAAKDATNPHFRSSYATLASVLDACRGPLTKNGLSVIQATEPSEQGIILVSMLAHSSGQWFQSRLPMILQKQDMQGIGSAFSYARRYALAALIGVAQSDDDAEEEVGRPEAVPQRQAVGSSSGAIRPKGDAPSEAQLKRLFAIADAAHWTNEEVKGFLREHFNVGSSKELTLVQYNELCDHIEAFPRQGHFKANAENAAGVK